MIARTIRILTPMLIAASALGQISGISAQSRCNFIVAGGVYYSLHDKDLSRKELCIIDPEDGHKEVLYTAAETLIEVALSPRCDYVACTEAIGGQRSLILVDMKGEITLRIPDVYHFSWAPDGKSIAYILGINDEDYPGFRPASIWVYRIDDSVARKLTCLGYDLAWAEHDGNLYVRDLGFKTGVNVYQYDPRDKETRETPHRAIFFSPNGRHYFRPSYEGSPFVLYLTESDTDVTEGVTSIGEDAIFWPRGWLNDSILIRPSQTSGIFRDTLLNIETDTQCVLPGEVITFPIEGDTFKIWHEGKITEVTLDSLTFIAPEKPEDK
ncbi:MAG: hypothetical protein AMXMBFR82_06040 [Candidatus Hydrogenedentota bacterium]